MKKQVVFLTSFLWLAVQALPCGFIAYAATGSDFAAIPPFVSSGAPPLVMLVMGRDHKLYYGAYNDASDLNEDGVLDIHYTPSIDYYGYSDSYKCYVYNTTDKRFVPTAKTTNKKCSGANEWSGDFLNYITMSRMDTMRKVLYGGYRSTDSATETVLERGFIPQDAHSWGKEYTSVAVDGYDIAHYTPFAVPTAGQRHLFASTTLTGPTSPPLLRYALNNTHRIWEWVAKERPVVDDSIASSGTTYASHPNNHADFENMVLTYANAAYLFGTGSWLNYGIRNNSSERYPGATAGNYGAIDGAGNPWGADYKPYSNGSAEQEHYLAIFTGTLQVTTAGTYTIAVDGDDAVEVIIDGGTANQAIIGFYGAHGTSGGPNNTGSVTLSAGPHTIEFRMEEAGGGDQYYLYWNGPDSGSAWQIIPAQKFTDLQLSTYRLSSPASTITNLEVRVKVCDPTIGLEPNCKQYPSGNYKPTGILQRHGEAKRMYFGLMTGSYTNNLSGGVLRKKMGDIGDEIETATTGAFKASVNGIIQTISKLRVYGYDYGSHSYNQDCGWITSGPMTQGQCRAWGNPTAEMMYETERYFAGKSAAGPTTDYVQNVASAASDDSQLGLPLATWNDPYGAKAQGGFDTCSKPFMLVLSDINPNFDADQLPGVDAANFGAGIAGDLPGLNVSTYANDISTVEGISGMKFIGQSGSTKDGVCSAKTVSGLADIRGLCPEEPTKGGGYYSAAVAYYGHLTDLNAAARDQKLTTYAVGLASPLPRIEFKIGPNEELITLVPFGKTIGGVGNPNLYSYSPTNTIVNFFVETLTSTYGKFRINYEDVEQGADHDMDAIVSYEYQLIDAVGNNVADPHNATQVKVTLTSIYAAGSYIQHLGYIISGTTADGPYLEVRDLDTTFAQDVQSPMDTFPGVPLSTDRLPHTTTRTFTPDPPASAAQLLPNPLWYAAKWGGYEEKDGSPGPTRQDEWDKDKDGIPDTYFYVTNPLRLEEQLNKSFADILNRSSSGTAASVISNTRSGEGAIYQSIFFPERTDTTGNANTVNWIGELHSFMVDSHGNMREDSTANKRLDVVGPDLNNDGKIYHEDINMNCGTPDTYTDPVTGKVITEDLNGNGVLDGEYSTGVCATHTTVAVDPFMSKLDAILVFDQGKFTRYYDVNGNGILDPQEKVFNIGATNVDSDDVQFLWNSTNWLNSITDADIITQRSSYLSKDKQRYIFTWVDADRDSRVTASEIKDFVWPATAPTINELDDVDTIYAYLNLYPSFANRPTAINSLAANSALFEPFLVKQTEREIQWVRGLDYVDANGRPLPYNTGSSDIAGTEMRARRFNNKTWRLGDIAYSTPTAVGAPAEAYHLLYKDASYADFYAKYQKRRNVIYAGANDGMLHAFNGGFYASYHKQFCREVAAGYNPFDSSSANDTPCVADALTNQPELGAELWAYIPYNLLPHLYWLTETSYTKDSHIYFVDQKPRIFDAKIFPADAVHTNGWGTIMVVGMRFGGASITADLNKLDGTVSVGTDPLMQSAFIIFDITNPEDKPILLGEVSMPKMGFSTSYPTMVVMKNGNHGSSFGNYNFLNPASGENRWFLAFGSGPADASGQPDATVLDTADSRQPGNFYMVDLVQLATNNALMSLTDSGANHGVLTAGLHPYFTLPEANSFISDSITVDFDLDYNADVLYFGTVSGTAGSWAGKLRRIIIDDRNDADSDQDPQNWVRDSVLIDVQQPITAAPTAAVDDDGRNWVFFGTGRYFVTPDAADKSIQSYYGIKEPVDTTTQKINWDTIPITSASPLTHNTLMNVTNIQVFADTNKTVNDGGASTWSTLLNNQSAKDGWYRDFLDTSGAPQGERNLGQAALLGGILSYTTFIPSSDICVAGGESFLWAPFYKTGTAYFKSILGTVSTTFSGNIMEMVLAKYSLGQGLATSPNIHVGREDGSTVFVQTSTGDIIRIEEENPLATKSGKSSWMQR